MGGHERERGSGVRTETEQCACKQKCSLVGDLWCVLQDLCSAHFWMYKPKRIFITDFRMLSHHLNVKHSNQTCQSPFPLPTHLHPLQTNIHALGWQLLRMSGKALVFAMLYHKQNLSFPHKRKFLKFNFLLKFIFNDQTLLNSMYTAGPLIRKNSLKGMMIKITDCCMNFYFPFKSTSEIWKKFNNFLKKQTNQTHQEDTTFLSIMMASFNQKLERGKALEGRDRKAWPQQAHTSKLQAALASEGLQRVFCFLYLEIANMGNNRKRTLWVTYSPPSC